MAAREFEKMDLSDKEDLKGFAAVNKNGYDGDSMGIRERTKKAERG